MPCKTARERPLLPQLLYTGWPYGKSECSRLLANCIIYYNASILSELLAYYIAQGDWDSVALLTQISPVAWQNTNFYGRYEFAKRPEAIDLALLIQELTQQPITPAPDSP